MNNAQNDKEKAYRTACKHAGIARVYFYDIDTKEEIALDDNREGLPFFGNSCNAIRDGVRYSDTYLAVDVLCHATRQIRNVARVDLPTPRSPTRNFSEPGCAACGKDRGERRGPLCQPCYDAWKMGRMSA